MRIGIGAIVKNEAPYLVEWIAFHQTIGVTDFFIADNESDDGTGELLGNLASRGVVTTFSMPGKAVQLDAYREILKRFGGTVDWMAFVDADEFIVPDSGSLPEFLRALPNLVGGVFINWACYGSSFLETRTDALVTERFQWRAKREWDTNRHYKSIARPKAIRAVVNPHHLAMNDSWAAADSNANPLHVIQPGLSADPVWNGIRVNHYVVKSREEFVTKKQRRGRATIDEQRPDEFFDAHDKNEVNDPMPPTLVDLTKGNMARITAALDAPASPVAPLVVSAVAAPPIPQMTASELATFRKYADTASNYLEFGAGGSTMIALSGSAKQIVSVESDVGWIRRLEQQQEVTAAIASRRLRLHHGDVGPTSKLGYPAGYLDQSRSDEHMWPNYYNSVWKHVAAAPDVVLVDGRFRVACAIATLLNCDRQTIVLIHDFWNRPHYHAILNFVDHVESVDTLGVFRRRRWASRAALRRAIATFAFDAQ